MCGADREEKSEWDAAAEKERGFGKERSLVRQEGLAVARQLNHGASFLAKSAHDLLSRLSVIRFSVRGKVEIREPRFSGNGTTPAGRHKIQQSFDLH